MGPFSVFGYLDLAADTQWIRVTPIRQNIRPDSAAIDAVVTLEHAGSGRVVTLRDSLFRFADPDVAGSSAWVHNFWTTEPLEPEATYRLRVERSDGAATTAVVEMPAEPHLTLRFFENPEVPFRLPLQLVVESEHFLYTDVAYTVFARLRGSGPLGVRPAGDRPGADAGHAPLCRYAPAGGPRGDRGYRLAV